MRVIGLVLRLLPGGLLWMAQQAAFLYMLAWARLAEAVIENPATSYIFKFPPLKDTLKKAMEARPDAPNQGRRKKKKKNKRKTSMVKTRAWFHCVTPRCAHDEAPDGQRFLKRYGCACTRLWIFKLKQGCPCMMKKHCSLATVKEVGGKKKITGDKA